MRTWLKKWYTEWCTLRSICFRIRGQTPPPLPVLDPVPGDVADVAAELDRLLALTEVNEAQQMRIAQLRCVIGSRWWPAYTIRQRIKRQWHGLWWLVGLFFATIVLILLSPILLIRAMTGWAAGPGIDWNKWDFRIGIAYGLVVVALIIGLPVMYVRANPKAPRDAFNTVSSTLESTTRSLMGWEKKAAEKAPAPPADAPLKPGEKDDKPVTPEVKDPVVTDTPANPAPANPAPANTDPDPNPKPDADKKTNPPPPPVPMPDAPVA